MSNLVLIIGESGSGKSALVREMCKRYGYKELLSYTDRPKRYENETGHTFVTESEANRIYNAENVIAYTIFDDHQYFCTEKQIEEADFYIVDVKGMQDVINHYHGDKNIYAVYIYVPEDLRAVRMLKRGDNPDDVKRRLEHDRKAFDCTLVVSNQIKNKDFEKSVRKLRRLMRYYGFLDKWRSICKG